jgi:hypothetical protein
MMSALSRLKHGFESRRERQPKTSIKYSFYANMRRSRRTVGNCLEWPRIACKLVADWWRLFAACSTPLYARLSVPKELRR